MKVLANDGISKSGIKALEKGGFGTSYFDISYLEPKSFNLPR